MKNSFLLALLLCVAMGIVWAQNPGDGPRNFPPGDMFPGKVTSVNKDTLVIVPLAGGDALTVKLSADTRVSRQRQPIKPEEIKNDDVVIVRGEKKDNTIQATLVAVVPPEMVERLRQGGGEMRFGGPGGGQFTRDDLGKKFIAGEVKAINETKLTIARPDGQTQDIEVDENTSFKKGQESITLPDIKVGDFVMGPGELKGETFVAKTLNVGRGRIVRMMGPESGPPPQGKPDAKSDAKPAEAPPKK